MILYVCGLSFAVIERRKEKRITTSVEFVKRKIERKIAENLECFSNKRPRKWKMERKIAENLECFSNKRPRGLYADVFFSF